MARPRVLCLDDPFLGLGREVADKVGDAVRAVAARGVAVLLTGQHVRRLLRLAHRGCVLDEGRVAFEGSGPALRDDPRLARAARGRGGLGAELGAGPSVSARVVCSDE